MDKSSLYTAIVTHPSGWKMGMHEHPHFEISVVTFGRGVLYAEDQVYSIREGDVILITPGVPHDYSSVTPIRFAVLQIENLSLELQQLFFQMTNEDSLLLFPLAEYALERYEKLFSVWIHISSVRPNKLFNRFLKTWIELFLLFLLERVDQQDTRITLDSVAEYIRSNLDKEVRITDLAQMIRMSESGLRACFKKTYGLSPKQYLQKYRMSEAKLLLKFSDKTIQQIASQVGFPNIHAFSAWFQKQNGVSPSQWRKEQQIIHDC